MRRAPLALMAGQKVREGRRPLTDLAKYMWLIAAVVPLVVMVSWMAVWSTSNSALWWIGPLLTFVILPLMDYLTGVDDTAVSDDRYAEVAADRFYRWATYLYLPNQYLSLIFACWLWSGGGWVSMSPTDKAGLMITVGITGAIGINAAHELGHKRVHLEKRLSKVALAQTCYGHFFVEHNRGHHVNVATPKDPASSRLGESVYLFLPRSIIGGFLSAWRLEAERLARRGKSTWTIRNHILNAWLLSVGLYVGLAAWFGTVVLPWLLGQAILGLSLLEIANYIEHYGLRRQLQPDGRYERVSPQHSWNSNTLLANVFLFHLQRHSDHHANPQRRYQTLRPSPDAPQLPGGYGLMLVLALCPPLWRKVMDRRVLAHYGGQIQLAAIHPSKESQILRKYADDLTSDRRAGTDRLTQRVADAGLEWGEQERG